jgi:hypothetical protein
MIQILLLVLVMATVFTTAELVLTHLFGEDEQL